MDHKYNIYGLTGIWNSLGCPTNPGEGISFYIEDVDSSDESLIDLCKFTIEKKDVGAIADQKVISELVVLLPMIDPNSPKPQVPAFVVQPSASVTTRICPACMDNPCGHPIITTTYNNKVYKPSQQNTSDWNYAAYTVPGDPGAYYIPANYSGPAVMEGQNYTPTDGYGYGYDYRYNHEAYEDSTPFVDTTLQTEKKSLENKKYLNLIPSQTELGAYLFQIDEDVVNNILSTIDYKILTIEQIKEILENKTSLDSKNNIVKLMRMMTKYNFPPHLNWLLNTKLPRIAMYVEEFSHILSKDDLSSIWQGTMPSIAMNPIEDREHVIEHFLTNDEIFGGYDIAELDIKLKIFKVKLRAKNNYYTDIVNDSTIKDAAKSSEQEKLKWYNFNWPYDNFSLVELLKIDAGEVRDYDAEFQVSSSIGTITYETTQDTNKTNNSYGSNNVLQSVDGSSFVDPAGPRLSSRD